MKRETIIFITESSLVAKFLHTSRFTGKYDYNQMGPIENGIIGKGFDFEISLPEILIQPSYSYYVFVSRNAPAHSVAFIFC